MAPKRVVYRARYEKQAPHYLARLHLGANRIWTKAYADTPEYYSRALRVVLLAAEVRSHVEQERSRGLG
jgi:hypothetical protein